jgi:hypothetical protein
MPWTSHPIMAARRWAWAWLHCSTAADSARFWYARSNNVTFHLAGLAMAEHDRGDDAESRRFMQALVGEHAHDSAYQIAGAFAWRGEHDEAFAWLQRAVSQHDAGLQYLKYDPALRSLRGDPRYCKLLLGLGLPP